MMFFLYDFLYTFAPMSLNVPAVYVASAAAGLDSIRLGRLRLSRLIAAHFASPGLCCAKPLSGPAKRRKQPEWYAKYFLPCTTANNQNATDGAWRSGKIYFILMKIQFLFYEFHFFALFSK
jgi:hypothetical protein